MGREVPQKGQIPDVKYLEGWSGSVAGLGGKAKAKEWVGCRAQLGGLVTAWHP